VSSNTLATLHVFYQDFQLERKDLPGIPVDLSLSLDTQDSDEFLLTRIHTGLWQSEKAYLKMSQMFAGKSPPVSPSSVDDMDGSPSPFSRHGKFQSSVRAELTSYQFKVVIARVVYVIVVVGCIVIFCNSSAQG